MKEAMSLRIVLIGLMTASGIIAAAAASDQVLALERSKAAQDCTDIRFLDGFLTEVDANGDGRPDYLANTQLLMCDGSQMMWCGTMGCVHRIWLQQSDGGFTVGLDTYAYEIAFDRPGDTSYRISTRDGTRRESLGGGGGGAQPSSQATTSADASAPSDRWVYRDNPPAALIGPAEARLSLTCEAGAVRLRYSGWWLFDGEGISSHAREWDRSEYGIVPTFAVGRHETDVPVRLDEAERMLVARQPLPLSAPLLDALAGGNHVTVIHGGSLEEELQFPLRGSAAALRSLRNNCTGT